MNEDFEPVRGTSQLEFILQSLGPMYAVLLLLSALIAFVLTALLVFRGKGSAAAVALLLIIPLPMFIGAFGALDALIDTYRIVADSMVEPRPSVIAGGIASTLIRMLMSMFVSGPTLVLALAGSSIRAWICKADEA